VHIPSVAHVVEYVILPFVWRACDNELEGSSACYFQGGSHRRRSRRRVSSVLRYEISIARRGNYDISRQHSRRVLDCEGN